MSYLQIRQIIITSTALRHFKMFAAQKLCLAELGVYAPLFAGELFTWGRGREGQLGHGKAAVPIDRDEHLPRLVRNLGPKVIHSASAGHAHSGAPQL